MRVEGKTEPVASDCWAPLLLCGAVVEGSIRRRRPSRLVGRPALVSLLFGYLFAWFRLFLIGLSRSVRDGPHKGNGNLSQRDGKPDRSPRRQEHPGEAKDGDQRGHPGGEVLSSPQRVTVGLGGDGLDVNLPIDRGLYCLLAGLPDAEAALGHSENPVSGSWKRPFVGC